MIKMKKQLDWKYEKIRNTDWKYEKNTGKLILYIQNFKSHRKKKRPVLNPNKNRESDWKYWCIRHTHTYTHKKKDR